MSINARTKGHNYERRIVQEFIKLGWINAKTTRLANPELDALKVDLVGTSPFQVQCKAVEAGVNYHKLLKSMPNNENHNVIFHKRNGHQVVVMDKATFYLLIKDLHKL